ncbi:MAG: hypothetical protein NTU43_01265 [Bacteroidetes bacterium]|nr:hypothetical protein [Bacteroidota bacterium]
MKRKNIILQLGFTFIIILSIHKIACAQQKSNFSFLLGANINNPHQLIENTNNPNDIKEAKAFGSIYLGIIYKNKIQFMLCNEIIESSVKFRNCNDVFLGSRWCRFNF